MGSTHVLRFQRQHNSTLRIIHRTSATLLGTNISFSQSTSEDEFPFSKVGYVCFLGAKVNKHQVQVSTPKPYESNTSLSVSEVSVFVCSKNQENYPESKLSLREFPPQT